MQKQIEKAEMLVEALPYIKKFAGKTVVVKYGGNAMINDEIKDQVMKDIVLMKYVGVNPVIVHGGGPAINSMLAKIGKVAEFKMGNRVTDGETMEIVEMVLSGKVNKGIVAGINRHGGKAIGLSGKDGNLILARKKYLMDGKEKVDIGFVGEVKKINASIIEDLQKDGFIPVISTVGVDEDGNTYNINADYVAGAIAGALNADKFLFMTDVPGLLRDINDPSSKISVLKYNEAKDLIEDGTISGGMLPKIDACMTALDAGAENVHIIDGRVKHTILLELFTDSGIGTMIVKDYRIVR
ncbi:acetylglutamate kinase [uncultured Ilyobacter sp.]|uniref:acetylglutamate kinase n=1 Tax=uncultured Ilyobacter sp. TaxID=544433 RepID=UPI0029F5BE50|nr:acetylglutamate kinase [uncultured Ilyobacter sp.]